jgi:hypothetical protein
MGGRVVRTVALIEHPAVVAGDMPALPRLLRGARLQVLARIFDEKDRTATERRGQFHFWSHLAPVCVGLATLLSAMVLAVTAAGGVAGLAKSLAIAAGVTGAGAALALHWLRQGNLLQQWMETRAQAEKARLDYFHAVVTAARQQPGFPLEQVLAYIRRYQLDVQQDFYRIRGRQHQHYGRFCLGLGAVAAFLGAVSSITVAGLDKPWLAMLGVLGTVLAAYASAQEAVRQDLRNAARYDHTRSALAGLEGMVDEVRAKLAAGDGAALELWVTALHEELSLEHQQWLKQGELTNTALNQLQERLKAPDNQATPLAPPP